MRPVGGYFELELNKGREEYHVGAIALKSGRSALLHLLNSLKPSLVHLPFYTCDGLLDPFEISEIRYQYYEINAALEPTALPELKPGEYFLYINYFDLKRTFSLELSEKYGPQLIVDCSQAYFMKGNGRSWFFNSCRKFFGVPDGFFLYSPRDKQLPVVDRRNEEYIAAHLLCRFDGHAALGYPAFQQNEIRCGGEVERMSKLSEYLLSNVTHEQVAAIRRNNFGFLAQEFGTANLFRFSSAANAVPMVYPLWLESPLNLSKLHEQELFIPVFWRDVLNRSVPGFALEKRLASTLLPLPIDHRYAIEDMKLMVTAINELK